MYDKLKLFWQLASKDLGFYLDLDHSVTLDSGVKVTSIFLVKGFGAKKGMLVLAEGTEITKYYNELNHLGYGFTFLSEPFKNEQYELEEYIEILNDWGWSGEQGDKPNFLTDDR